MMLNGRLTHEASRVGALEAIHSLLVGEKADTTKAIQLAYREILTRQPSKDEVAEAKTIISDAQTPLEGMADLLAVTKLRRIPFPSLMRGGPRADAS